MFRTSYVHHQEDCIVHAALYGMLFMHLCKQSVMLKYRAHPSTWQTACSFTHPKTTQTQVQGFEIPGQLRMGNWEQSFHCRGDFEWAARLSLSLCLQIMDHFMKQCVENCAQCNIVPFHYTCPPDQCLPLVSCNLLVYCRVRMECSSTKERTVLQLADCL
jgi:hypothetical protein